MRRYEGVLRQLGLWKSFTALPMCIREQFCQYKYPDPVVEFDPSYPDDDAHRALRKTIESQFREALLELENGIAITVRDMVSVVFGLKTTVDGSLKTPMPEGIRRFFAEAKPWIDHVYEQRQEIFLPIHSAIVLPLYRLSRLDGRLLNLQYHFDLTRHHKQLMRLVIGATPPQVRHVTLDGEPRPMYRVGAINTWSGVKWLSWDAQNLGHMHGGPTEYPVYIQSHALRNLRERANLPGLAQYLDDYLYESLKQPVIVERTGNDLLVEFRIREDRIGYLIVTPLKDMVAVRTFKFLTMENTPEARELNRRLGLKRPEIDWLGLSELTAFTQTDLRNDQELRDLLADCGCGHLFEIAEEYDFAPAQPKALAGEMRKYLRMAA